MNIEEMDKKLKDICEIILNVNSVLEDVEKSMQDLDEKEEDLESLYSQLDNIPLPIPYIGQPMHSMAWIKDLTSVQFEDMIFNLFAHRNAHREIVYKIKELENRKGNE